MPEGDAMEIRVLGELPYQEILRRDEESLAQGLPRVQIAVCAERCVTLGVSQREDVEIALRRHDPELAIYRRTSGGTAVLHHPGDLFWSVVVPRQPQWTGRDFVHGYSRFGRGWVDWLLQRGHPSRWEKTGAWFSAYCFLSGLGEALVAGSGVLGGAGQHVTSRALLHHGAVPLTVEPRETEELFGMPEGMATERLTSLRRLGLEPTADDLQDIASRLAEGVEHPDEVPRAAPGGGQGAETRL